MSRRRVSFAVFRFAVSAVVCFSASRMFAQTGERTGSATGAKEGTPMKMLSEMSGEGRPIVLVPGGLTGWVSWEPHAKRLAEGRKVVRVQLLAVQLGLENTPLPADYTVRTESRALAETIRDLNLPLPFDIAAWSYGGLISLDYALNNPGHVRTLTLIEPPVMWVLPDSLDAETGKTIATMKKLRGDISEEKLAEFLASVGFSPPGKSIRELPQWPVWVRHRLSLRSSPAVVAHTDDPARLRNFLTPVLLVKGTGSARFLHQIIDGLSTLLPRSRVVEMPAGHAPQIVSMDRFLEEMERFQRGAEAE